VKIGGQTRMSVAEGNGPVNALDKALRKDLGRYQDVIKGLKLVDYKVRIFQGGTDAVTRVLIDSADGPSAGPRSASAPTSSTPRSRRWWIRSPTGW
jgi:2-isopropylmalate synthase